MNNDCHFPKAQIWEDKKGSWLWLLLFIYYNSYKRLPVQLPQSLRGVSVVLGLGEGTSPHPCVCSKKPRRGFQSSPAPENRDHTPSVRQTSGEQTATRGHREAADGPRTWTQRCVKKKLNRKMKNISGSLGLSVSTLTVFALLRCVL